MFEMRPVFVVEPFWGKGGEPPRMAIAEAVLRVVDGDGYLCRLAAVPWLPWRVFEAFVRLEGVSVPEGGEPDCRDMLRAEAVKDFAVWRMREAKLVMLRDFHRDKSGRVLVDVHVDHCDFAVMLGQVARQKEAELRGAAARKLQLLSRGTPVYSS